MTSDISSILRIEFAPIISLITSFGVLLSKENELL